MSGPLATAPPVRVDIGDECPHCLQPHHRGDLYVCVTCDHPVCPFCVVMSGRDPGCPACEREKGGR